MTLDAVEFLRRFMRHILPRGLKRIRYFGFLANGRRAGMIVRCRELIAAAGCAIGEGAHAAVEPAAPTARPCAKCGHESVVPVAIIYGRSYVRGLRRRSTLGDTS